MRPGGKKRGNNKDRRARKLWMLDHFGNGVSCSCAHCSTVLAYETVEADRIIPGGPYVRRNVQPACGPCNKSRSNNADWVSPALMPVMA